MKNSPEQSESVSPVCTEVEELGRLLGVIAHEIKNPLSTIKVNLRLIDEELSASPKAGETSPKGGQTSSDQHVARARRKLAVIDKETTRLEQILDSFLHYADRSMPRLAPLDINTIVGDMIDFFTPQAIAHSITMRQCLHKEPLICQADAGMLKQAILNLLINAQQALNRTGSGQAIGPSGELMVRTARGLGAPGLAQIQISDTGKGIPADRLAHIFEPYQSSRPNGTGLGLATVKKIIDAHKGSISVASEPGKGTAFTISLPLASQEDK
jgi:signal transduction histidine kinase